MRHALFLVLIVLILLGCKEGKRYHDEKKVETTLSTVGALEGILQFQANLNEEFKNPESSPLPDRYRKNFKSLEFFEPDSNYVVKDDRFGSSFGPEGRIRWRDRR